MTQQLLLSLAAAVDSVVTQTKEVIKNYFSRQKPLERDIYTRPPEEISLPEENILKVIKAVHGTEKSGFHRYRAYLSHHVEKFRMVRSTVHP